MCVGVHVKLQLLFVFNQNRYASTKFGSHSVSDLVKIRSAVLEMFLLSDTHVDGRSHFKRRSSRLRTLRKLSN
jgi:hypothetical protein